MSRRDVVVNTSIGFFLLAVAFLVLLAYVAALWLAIWTIKDLAGRFFPGVTVPFPVALFTVLGISSLASGVGHLRGRRWRNAFVSLALIPMGVSIWFANPHLPFGLDGFPYVWLTVIAFFPGEKLFLQRSEFILSASILIAVMAVNSGIFGFGVFTHYLLVCTLLAAIVLLAIKVRRRQTTVDPDTSPIPA
jgi:hypothetical protein